jgi:two-component system phosphate regulon sensor histidine kinase PhoR
MNTKKYYWLFYLITITIVATIAVQFYWNYKNYQENQQRVTNEIQLSLDNAIEEYYSSIAKSNFITIIDSENNDENNQSFSDSTMGRILTKIKKNAARGEKPKITINNIKITTDDNLSKEKVDSMMNSAKELVSEFNTESEDYAKDSETKKIDSIKIVTQFVDDKSEYTLNKNGTKKNITYYKGKKAADSLKVLSNLKPIFISFLDQSVTYKKIDSLIENQLKKKGITLKTSFHHLKNDTLFHQTKDSILASKTFSVSSKSTYLKDNEVFKLVYNDIGLEALKRSSLGILLSLLLSLLIISCLFYLLRVINQQKDLAAIKNDLISNITHEFKTPIATVSAAVEALENFNVLEDAEKTKKYLSMSSVQLKKLHQMVEKLLETATLDSEQLLLKKETIDIVEVAEKLVSKHKLLSTSKELIFSSNLQPIYILVDVFHFENAISNLIDNAVKYGGNRVEININSVLKSTEITVVDDGEGIEKNQQEKIFDQFYRVPKGNTHDIKGFGIGLYYCKKIIEKHQGTLALLSEKNKTVFKITIPNE